MNAVSDSTNNFIEENGDGSDSDHNTDESPEYYQPISVGEYASDSDQSSDDTDSRFHHHLPNGYSNGVVNGVSSLDLSDNDDDDEEMKVKEEEEIERAVREDERRRNAPVPAENAARILEAMRGIRFSGAAPIWVGTVPEDQWINQIRRLREPQASARD